MIREDCYSKIEIAHETQVTLQGIGIRGESNGVILSHGTSLDDRHDRASEIYTLSTIREFFKLVEHDLGKGHIIRALSTQLSLLRYLSYWDNLIGEGKAFKVLVFKPSS